MVCFSNFKPLERSLILLEQFQPRSGKRRRSLGQLGGGVEEGGDVAVDDVVGDMASKVSGNLAAMVVCLVGKGGGDMDAKLLSLSPFGFTHQEVLKVKFKFFLGGKQEFENSNDKSR